MYFWKFPVKFSYSGRYMYTYILSIKILKLKVIVWILTYDIFINEMEWIMNVYLYIYENAICEKMRFTYIHVFEGFPTYSIPQTQIISGKYVGNYTHKLKVQKK